MSVWFDYGRGSLHGCMHCRQYCMKCCVYECVMASVLGVLVECKLSRLHWLTWNMSRLQVCVLYRVHDAFQCTCMHAHTHTHTHMHTHLYSHICTNLYSHIHLFSLSHTHTHTHTHLYLHTHSLTHKLHAWSICFAAFFNNSQSTFNINKDYISDTKAR